MAAQHSVDQEELARVERERKAKWDEWLRQWEQRCRTRARRMVALASSTEPSAPATPEDDWSELVWDWMDAHNITYEGAADNMSLSGCNVSAVKTQNGSVVALQPVRACNLAREARNLQLCTGMAHVLQLADVGSGSDPCGIVVVRKQEIAVVVELLHGIPLCQAVRLPEWGTLICVPCVHTLLAGVNAMHSFGLVHGNIHTSSFLVNPVQQSVTLTDVSRSVLHGEWMEDYGTQGWWAPELCKEKAKQVSVSRRGTAAMRLDVWATGVTACCMVAHCMQVCLYVTEQDSWMEGLARKMHWERYDRDQGMHILVHRLQLTASQSVLPARSSWVWKVMYRALHMHADVRADMASLMQIVG